MHELKKKVNEGIEQINETWHNAIKESHKKPDATLDLGSVIVETSKIRSRVDSAFMDYEARTKKTQWFK